jgi:sugar phosphate isomerase/epimerase/acetylornithine deacetylase/succinyl-diaminopimelate desuccinylase-like protein
VSPEALVAGAGAAAGLEAAGIRFAGIGDEAGSALADQIGALQALGWGLIELRTVGGTAIGDLEDGAFAALVAALDAAGLRAACVDSRIAGWARPITGPLEDDLAELDRLARRSAALGTPYVRVMSYPNDGLDEVAWGRRVVERMRRLAERAERAGLVLLHENCAGWAGRDAARMLALLEAVGSPALRLLFDSGNAVAYGYDSYDLLKEIVGQVAHVHVKDARGEEAAPVYTLPGEGACRVADCLRLLLEHGFKGTWTIEPHLRFRPHEGLTDVGEDGAELFVAYGRRLERLVAERVLAPPPAAPRPGPAGAGPARAGAAAPLARVGPDDHELLLHLLDLPTAGPLETGDCSARLWEAEEAYAEAAGESGLRVVHQAPAGAAALEPAITPLVVREAVERMPGFLQCQPSMVLRLGPELDRSSTVMFNVHLDTVAGGQPASFDGARFHGRGAIDAKGPAVALLAGIRAAAAASPAIGREVAVLVQAVAGEEGGAAGVLGTRPLVRQGWVGRLNLFCEPTGRRLLNRSTAAMTPCIVVAGRDAVDDDPGAGHNASVLLGFLAQHLAGELASVPADARVCVAGLRTGPLHNRVYGQGRLLLNLAYGSRESAARLESALRRALEGGLAEFARRFGGNPALARTAGDAAAITSVQWHKRGLPALHSVDPWARRFLEAEVGLAAWPEGRPGFTCDAIWMQGLPGTFTAVYGPGDLVADNAHAAGERAELAELERFAGDVARLLVRFARQRSRRLGEEGRQ